jgi:hypothetical protein
VAEAISTSFYNKKKSKLTGSDLIICNILKTYVNIILKRDSGLVPLELVELEHNISNQITIESGNKKEILRIGGVIDRLDRTKGIYRITDYKTGKTAMEIPALESLFDENSMDHNDAWFQILMYCNIIMLEQNGMHIHPSIYSVRNMFNADFIDTLRIKDLNGQAVRVDDFGEVFESFNSLLMLTIQTIFNPDEPFRMTENLKRCEYCPFKKLCQR